MLWVTAAYGACFIGIQWGLRDAPLLWFAALRALVAGVALLVVAGAKRRPAPRGASIWRLIALLGVVNVAIGFAAMFGGVSGLATGTAAVLSNAQPLLILLPAWWLYGEAVSARTTGALLVGFVGLLVVAVPGGGGRGAGLALLSAVAITTGTLLARRLVGVDLVVAGGWHLVLGGVVLTVAAAVVEGSPSISWTPRFVAVVAFLGLVGTAATTLAWFAEVRESRLDALSAWTFLTPVFGIVLGGAVLGEVPTGWTAVGLAVVLASMWLVLRPRSAARSSAAHAATSADILTRRGRVSSR